MQYVPYESLGVTAAVIAAALAFVVLAWNAVKAIHDWRVMVGKKTSDALADHEQRITHLEECCAEVHGKLQSDWEWQRDEAEMNRLLLRSIKQLLKHSIDGNDTQGLMEMEGAIDAYLIDHAK